MSSTLAATPDPSVKRKMSVPTASFLLNKIRRISATSSAASITSHESVLKRPKCSCSFATLLITVTVALAALVAPLAWYFTNTAGTNVVMLFAGQLQSLVLEHSVGGIVTHLDMAERLSGLQQLDWKYGTFVMSNKQGAMRQLLPRLLNNYDLVVSQGFTTVNGELWGYYSSLTDNNNASTRYFSRWEQYGSLYTQYLIDTNDNILGTLDSSTTANNSQSAWVTIVDKTNPKDIAWVPVYVWSNVAWITNSRPIYDVMGTYIGVAFTDLELSFLNHLLYTRTKVVSRPTVMYAFEAQTEYIVGTSSLTLDIFSRDSTGQAQLPYTMKELATATGGATKPDPIIAALYKSLNERKLSLAQVTNSSLMLTATNGSVWMVTLATLQWHSVQWVMVQAMDQQEVMRDINNGTVLTVAVVLGLTVACAALCGVFSVTFTHSLRRVTEQLQTIASLGFESVDMAGHPVGRPSLVRESLHIQQAFMAMVRAFGKASNDHNALRSMAITTVSPQSSSSSSAGKAKKSSAGVHTVIKSSAALGSVSATGLAVPK